MSSRPSFRFLTEEARLALHPREVIVEQEIGKIDFAEIKTSAVVPGTPAIKQGRAVSFSFGDAANRLISDAYVTGSNDVAQRSGTTQSSQTVLQCMGPPSVMRDKRRKAWRNRTIPEVVRDIATAYRFNVVVDPHPLRWSLLPQDGVSDWAFVCSLAQRLGWWPYFMGTTLYFLNPDFIVGRQNALAVDPPSMSGNFSHQTRDQPYIGKSQLTLLRGRFSDVSSGRTHYFEPTTRRTPISSKVPTVVNVADVSIEAANYAEAQAIFNGMEREGAWYMERSLSLDGRVDLHPFKSVFLRSPRIRGVRTKTTDPGWGEYDGLWIVKAVQHRLTFGQTPDFTTKVSLVRDGRGMPNLRQRHASPIRFNQRPPNRLVNGTWVASWSTAA